MKQASLDPPVVAFVRARGGALLVSEQVYLVG
jgi:hypothetical protein